MSRTSAFISTVATVFQHSSLTLPTPFPVSMSSTSVDHPSESVSRTTSSSSSSSSSSTTSIKSSRRSKKFSTKLKEHKDVWWASTQRNAAQYRDYQPQVLHEWSYMYL